MSGCMLKYSLIIYAHQTVIVFHEVVAICDSGLIYGQCETIYTSAECNCQPVMYDLIQVFPVNSGVLRHGWTGKCDLVTYFRN